MAGTGSLSPNSVDFSSIRYFNYALGVECNLGMKSVNAVEKAPKPQYLWPKNSAHSEQVKNNRDLCNSSYHILLCY